MKYSRFLLISCFFIGLMISAQEKKAGPVIEKHGAVWAVENQDFKTDTSAEFKVVFDIMDSPDSHTEINKKIETAARFLNMHTQNGVPLSQLKVALVVHGGATKDLAHNEAYQDRFGTINPNYDLINELQNAGVQVILCGQSSNSRKYPREDLIPGSKIALSAMTALIQLQNQGYRLIKF